MTTVTSCRRTAERHSTPEADRAGIEIDWPLDSGTRHRLPLVDVSVSGLSFSFEDELTGIEVGANFPEAVVRLGDCEIHGELVVMHVTPQSENRFVCGALFYTDSDTDLIKWRAAIAGMDAVR